MKILYDTTTRKLVPYPRNDDNPVEGLADHFQVLALVQESVPVLDPATHEAQATETLDLTAGVLTRGWNVRAVTATAPEPAPKKDAMPAGWKSFVNHLRTNTEFNQVLASARAADAEYLVNELSFWIFRECVEAPNDMAVAFPAVLVRGKATPALIAQLSAKAEECKLPPSVALAIRSSQPQPWDAAAAYLIGSRVTHNGKTWVATSNNTGNEPDDVPGDWSEAGV